MFSRCGDAWSIDALIRKGRGANKTQGPAEMSGEYTWPVRMIWAVIVMIYFVAGVSKVRHSGFEWINSDTMHNILIWHSYHMASADPLTAWGHPMLSRSVVMSRIKLAIWTGWGLMLRALFCSAGVSDIC